MAMMHIGAVVSSGTAYAHGSLPISQQILWRDGTMLVPAAYWGLFVGTDGGPWRWICEEAINANQSRQMALVSDGTLYATDRTGLSVSRDGGCTWTAEPVAPGGVKLQIVTVVSDPQRPRAWALAYGGDGAASSTGLWHSDDAGRTWQLPYAMPDYLPSGLRISDDGKTLIIGSATSQQPRQAVLHVSSDGGKSFSSRTLSHLIDGQPLAFFRPTWIDPRSSDRAYLQAEAANGTILLRVDGQSAPVEVLRVPAVITAMTLSPSSQLLVGTDQGVYAAIGDGPFTMLSTLRSAQCFSQQQGAFYACAWNYAPDQAAIARLAPDASSFAKVFQFSDTVSPVDCPADTPAAKICPSVWTGYADQLGVRLGPEPTPDDTKPPSSGCAYAETPPAGMPALWGALLLSMLSLAGRRTRRRLQKSFC